MSSNSAFSGDTAILADLLLKSISENEAERSAAYARMLELEANPSFLATLIDVAYCDNEDVSKLAFICAKNAITRMRGVSTVRTIRGNNNNHVSNVAVENLKEKMYAVLQAHFASNSRVVSKDFNLILRKLCRCNYPQGWMKLHQLLEEMLEAATSSDSPPTLTLNAIMVTYNIFKEKSTMKLMKDRNVTLQLVGSFQPYVSKLWMKNWNSMWEVSAIEQGRTRTRFSSIDIAISRYVDSALIIMYTHGPRDIYQKRELTDLLKLVCVKLKLHLEMSRMSQERHTILEKNTRRLLRCIGNMFEYEATVFAFVEPSLILSPVFEYLAQSKSTRITSECMKLLSNAFKSPIINNDRYMQQYFELREEGKVSKGAGKTKSEDIAFYYTFEEMKAHHEMSSSCTNDGTPNKLLKKSSPTKGAYYNMGSISECLSRQATFLFWETITGHGGQLQLVEFLRELYLTINQETLEEWNEDPLPMEEPGQPEVYMLIDAMKIAGSEMFQHVIGGIMSTDSKSNVLRFDSYLSLYTISYNNMANLHCSKHYLLILESLKKAMDSAHPSCIKLVIFRCSRIINAWVKRINLFEEQVKIEILKYLLFCICCEGDSLSTLNLRVQHLVPFYHLYCKTIDQPFWDVLRQANDVSRVVSSVHMLTKVDIPAIQHKALELLCKMCLEFDNETNNFGNQLSDLISSYSGGFNDLLLTTSLLQTSLSFLNALDWQRCYKEESYVNSHLLRFLFHLLFKMLVISDAPPMSNYRRRAGDVNTRCIVSLNRYTELEDDTLTLWLCLLRVLPQKIETVEQELRSDIFALFPLLLSYLTKYDSNESTGKMIVCSGPALALDLVTEYLTVVLDYIKSSAMSNSPGEGGKVSTNISHHRSEILLQVSHANLGNIEFSITKIQALCLQCLKYPDDDPLRHGAIRLINMLMFGFSETCTSNKDMLYVLKSLVFFFLEKLNEGGMRSAELPPDIQRSKLSCLSDRSCPDKNAYWVHSRLVSGVVESIAGLVPILCRWAFDSPVSFNDAIIFSLDRILICSPEALILSLIHASEQFTNNAYLRLGALICCSLITIVMLHRYDGLKLFIYYQKPPAASTTVSDSQESMYPSNANMHGVYVPSYMLRLVDSIVSLFVESKRSYCFSISKATLLKDGNDYNLPPSKRYHLFSNASSTYSSTALPLSDMPEHDLFYGAVNSTVTCFTHLAHVAGVCAIPQSMDLFLEEANRINPKIREMINACRSGIK